MTEWVKATELTIRLDEQDRYNRQSMLELLTVRARKAGLAGFTVLRGVEGYGNTKTLHSEHILSLSDNMPLLLIVIDDAEKVDAFVESNQEVLSELLLTKHEILTSTRTSR